MRVIFMQFSGAKKHTKQAAGFMLFVGGVAVVVTTLLFASARVRWHARALVDFAVLQTRPRKLALYCHDVYNEHLKQQLESYTIKHIASASVARLKPDELYSGITNTFPVIERISWHMPRPLFAEVHVYGTQPIWRLGDDYVIGANNAIYPREQFAQFALQKLPQVTFSSGEGAQQASPEIMQWLTSLPEVVTAKFDVQYVSAMQVELRTPNGRLVVTARKDQVHDTKKLAAVVALYRQLDATQRAQYHWRYDIRFNNPVIATKQKQDSSTGMGQQ